MAQEHMKSSQIGISHSTDLDMAGYSHTLPLLMSKLRGSLEAGKKLFRVWIRYVCSVTKMFLHEPSGRGELLYPSFGAPLVFLLPPYDGSEMVRRWFEDARYDELMWNVARSGLRCFMNISFRSTIECILR